MLYQRISLATGENVGEPGPLPRVFQGAMTDDTLARVGEIVPRELSEFADAGFIPYTPPPPAPRAIREVHKLVFKLRFTADERIAIRAAAATNPVVEDIVDLIDSASTVLLDSQPLIDGVAAMVSLGLLNRSRVAAIRADG